jgi:hypothetical protein
VKPTRGRLEQHVEHWTKVRGDTARHVYHFTHVSNAAEILTRGEILSRAASVREGVQFHDSGSEAVMSKTPGAAKEFVRLYFRPRTPTQYHNEGIRPGWAVHSQHRRQCPVPVFFAYDLVDLLSQEDASFSDGNMGAEGVRHGASIDLFESIPFENVYHVGGRSTAPDPARVIFHRCAEVLVPDRLPIDGLRAIYCRTHAERRTLIHKLDQGLRSRWAPTIKVVGGFYDRRWAFVEQVTANPSTVTFLLHPPADGTPMDLKFEFQARDGVWGWAQQSYSHKDLQITVGSADSVGFASLRIFGHEAFAAPVTLADLPF